MQVEARFARAGTPGMHSAFDYITADGYADSYRVPNCRTKQIDALVTPTPERNYLQDLREVPATGGSPTAVPAPLETDFAFDYGPESASRQLVYYCHVHLLDSKL